MSTISEQLALSKHRLMERIVDLEEQLEAARNRNSELHRRCQLAEGAVLRKMKAEQVAGAPLAKRLAMAGYAAEQEARLDCENKLERIRAVAEDRHDHGEEGWGKCSISGYCLILKIIGPPSTGPGDSNG
jgi:hypothetical protein